MMRCLATYHMPNEWDFHVYSIEVDFETVYPALGEPYNASVGSYYAVYPARDDKGMMLDLTRCNRINTACIKKYPVFPNYFDVVRDTANWHGMLHPAFDFLSNNSIKDHSYGIHHA